MAFHDPIKRYTIKSFGCNTKKTVLSNKKSIDVNRDILAKLLSISIKQEKKIDFEKALTHPLSEVPLSLCNADGSMRKTNKSKLAKNILSRIIEESSDFNKIHTAFIVDFMALVRTMSQLPETFEELALKLVQHIPKGYHRIDLVADCYLSNSIKDAERAKRGQSTKILVKSTKSKIPREFSKFLANGENKTRMIELIFETLEEKKAAVLNTLRTTQLVLSSEQNCKIITLSNCETFQSLVSNQEEADTKVITHGLQFLKTNTNHQVIIRSPSGDTDIIVLVVSLLYDYKDRVIIDNGSGKERKSIWIGGIELSQHRCHSLIGLHSFTGNDYVSSFFKTGKRSMLEIVREVPEV